MRFESFLPCDALRPYVAKLVISESELRDDYTVLPSTGLVAGFQFRGRLERHKPNGTQLLSTSGVTGLSDRQQHFSSLGPTSTLLVYFTETGASAFSDLPMHELFGQSESLTELFPKNAVLELEERLCEAKNDAGRLGLVEKFLLGQLRNFNTDRLVAEAVRLIYASKGVIRVAALQERLHISPSPLEKRFRSRVGTTPKKFADIVRMNAVLDSLGTGKSIADVIYDNGFFDQAHFIQQFSKFTGETPERYSKKMK